MSDKIIFLDFDGVISTERASIANGERGLLVSLDTIGVKFLDRICTQYGIKIVISSTWRKSRDRSYFRELFQCFGYTALAKALHEEYATPQLSGAIRGEEILQWFNDSNYNGSKQCKYLIIDDNSDFHEEQLPHLILTDIYDGMLTKHFRQIEKWCNQ